MHRLLVAVALAAASIHSAFAQQIALPSGTVEGYLRNGLHYLIKPNDLPRHTVEFRLVMRVGSLQESDMQRGGAHFLEHMSFNGMREFPEGTMVDYFERQGMKYGRDINAFTGFDRTIYWFTVPTYGDASATIDTTLMAMRGILTDLTLDEERTRQERGIIVEELRGYDTHDPFYALKIGNGRHARRVPLGSEGDILQMDRSRLLDFYERWYAPQFATLLVVGNVDAAQLEGRIRHYFSDLPRHGARTLKAEPLAYRRGTQLMERGDSLNASSRLEMMIPHRVTAVATIADAVEHQRDWLFCQAVSDRLSAAHVPCNVSDQWYLADQGHFVFAYNFRDRDSLAAYLRRTADVLCYLAEHGPEATELQALVESRRHSLHGSGGTVLSSVWCDDLTDYVVVGDRHLCSDADVAKVREGIGQTRPRDVQRRARQLLTDMQRHLLVAYSNHGGEAARLDGQEVWTAWRKGRATNAPPYQPRRQDGGEEAHALAVPDVLTAEHPYNEHEAVSSWHVYSDLGVSEAVLRNGVRLLFRPTLDGERSVQLMAMGRGGISSLNDDDCHQLKDAVAYMDMGGIEGIDPDTLMDVMGQLGISLNVGLEDEWHQLLATSGAEHAQVMLNLAYEKMHHPHKDYADFEDSRQSELEGWGQETLLSRLMRNDPGRLMANCIDTLVGNVLVRRPMRREDLEAMNLDRMEEYYRLLYTDPQGLTLVLTGNYDLPTVERAAIGTFARMQRPDSVLTVNDEPVQPLRSCTRHFVNDTPSQTVFNYLFASNYMPSLRTTLTFKLMRDLMQKRMLEVLRERENIVYSPYSDLYYRGLPQRTYYFWLCIAVKNENAERMKQALREVIEGLQRQPVSDGELEKMKRSFIVTKRQQLSDVAPTEWRNTLTNLLRNGESLEDFDRYEEVLGSITPEEVQEAFRMYIDFDHPILMCQGGE